MPASKNSFNLILLGTVMAGSDPDRTLQTWMPGSGLPDDRLVTDQIIGALVRAGYAVESLRTMMHCIDMSLYPTMTTPDSWDTMSEAASISNALGTGFPEFRPSAVLVCSPDTYGIAEAIPPRGAPCVQEVQEPIGTPKPVKPAARTPKGKPPRPRK